MKQFLLSIFTLLAHLSFGQTLLNRQYSLGTNTQANAVIQTTDGGYLLAGFIHEADLSTKDVLLIKTNAQGDTTWTRTIKLGQSEEATAIVQTVDGGYYIGGNQFISNTPPIPSHFNWLVIRCNAQGDTLWTKSWGLSKNDKLFALADDGNAGVLAVGYRDLAGYALGAFSKLTPTGHLTANSQFTGLTAIIQDVEVDNQGNMWLTGSNFSGNSHDFTLFRFNGQSGNPIFNKFKVLQVAAYASRMNRFSNGSMVLSGASGSNLNWRPQLMRVSPNFDTVWTRRYPDFNVTMGQEKGALSSVTNQNQIYFGFTENELSGATKGRFMMVSQLGNLEKSFEVGGSGNFGFQDLITNSNQKPVFCGYASTPNASQSNAWLVIPDPDFVTSTTKKVKEGTSWIYPNPAKNKLAWHSETPIERIELFNPFGQLVFSKSISQNENQMEFRAIPKGIYMVKIIGNKFEKVERLIVE